MPKRPKECTLMKILGSKYLKGSESSCVYSLGEHGIVEKPLTANQ